MTRLRKFLKRMFAEDKGFTFAEVATVSMLLGVVLASSYLALGAVNNVSDDMTARASAQQQGQIALEKMVRELRQGQVIFDANDDPHRFAQLSSTVVSFYADIDHNGTVDRVTYTLSSGTLTRKIAQSGKASPTPTDFGSDSTPVELADVPDSLTSIFQYTDADSPPNIVTADGQVNAVLINLKTISSSGSTSITVEFPQTEVQIRAFPSS